MSEWGKGWSDPYNERPSVEQSDSPEDSKSIWSNGEGWGSRNADFGDYDRHKRPPEDVPSGGSSRGSIFTRWFRDFFDRGADNDSGL